MSKISLIFLFAAFVGVAVAPSFADDVDLLDDFLSRSVQPKSRDIRQQQNKNPRNQVMEEAKPIETKQTTITSKQQYIDYLKYKATDTQKDCGDKYKKYVDYFGYNGDEKILEHPTSARIGMLDAICQFHPYANWCFSLGFAFANPRPQNDDIRMSQGRVCYTYPEFCIKNSKTFDITKLDTYMSRVMDEITYYYRNIHGTEKNTILTTTEKMVGTQKTTTTSYHDYNTDEWVFKQIPESSMVLMLCK